MLEPVDRRIPLASMAGNSALCDQDCLVECKLHLITLSAPLMKRHELPKNFLTTILASIAITLSLASCASTKGKKGGVSDGKKLSPPTEPAVYSWDESLASSTSGPVRIKIGIEQQRARIFKGDKEIGWTTVASGIPRFPTPTGSFSILEKVVDKHSNLYGKIYDGSGSCINSDAKMGRDRIPSGGKFEGAQMKYWMRLTHDGVGMHIGPQPRPGYRASHGCIRLPAYMAQQIYQVAPLGTPVTIVADDGTEPLSKGRDAYEAELATYKTWVAGEWDKHNARMADTPEGRKAAKAKVKAAKEAAKLAAKQAKSPPPARTEVRTSQEIPEPTAPASDQPVTGAATDGTGQTAFLDPQAL